MASKVLRPVYIEILLGIAGVVNGIIVLLLAVGDYSDQIFMEYVSRPKLLVLNFIPVVILIFLLYGVFGRATVAYGIGSLTILTISLCNYYKLVFRDDPLMFEDILIIREAATMSESYSLFVNTKIISIVVLMGLITFLICVVEKKVNEKRNKRRRLGIVTLLIVASCFFYPIYKSNDIYASFDNFKKVNFNSQTQIYVAHGFIYPFIHSISQSKDIVPDEYDKQKIEELLAKHMDEDIPKDKKVNVFAVMREAYADFSKYGIDGLDCAEYELYHQLQDESYSGELYVNIFGGGTAYTEREFLTGSSNIKNYRGRTNSYVWYFRQQGYRVEGSHPFHEWFYNRRNINSYLGFENYRFYENDYQTMTDTYYPEDKYLYSEIYKDYLAKKESGKPYFSFSVNVQSHGPYDITGNRGEKEYLFGEQYSDDCKHAMNNYMDIIMDSDRELGNFIELLRNEEEPVVFVLFSDHLPWMGDGNIYYEEMGIDFTQESDEAYKIQYTTEYLIWANNSAKKLLNAEFCGTGPMISPCYLMNLLFQQCSWNGPAYMQIMNEMMEVMPVISLNGVFVIDGNFGHGIPEDRASFYATFSQLQYYWKNVFLWENCL